MKLSSTIGLILLVSFVFVAWGIIINDFETNYIDTGISNASSINETFLQSFDNSEELNRTMQPIITGFEDIATDEWFFDRIQDLAVVVPIAIISIPRLIFAQLGILITTTARLFELIKIPLPIVLIGLIGLMMFIVFKLVEFWRRTPV